MRGETLEVAIKEDITAANIPFCVSSRECSFEMFGLKFFCDDNSSSLPSAHRVHSCTYDYLDEIGSVRNKYNS